MKSYRDGYMSSRVKSSIAHQIRNIRMKLGLSQAGLANKLQKPQSVISRLEDADYGRVSVKTLIEVAAALDIAVYVKFSGYPEFLSVMGNADSLGSDVETIAQTTLRQARFSEQSAFTAGKIEASGYIGSTSGNGFSGHAFATVSSVTKSLIAKPAPSSFEFSAANQLQHGAH